MSLPGKTLLKEDDKAHMVESLTPRRQEQDSQQSSLPQTPDSQPLLGAMAQIKVLIYTVSVDLEIIHQVDLLATSPLLSLTRCLSALREKGKNELCLLPSVEEKFKGSVEQASLYVSIAKGQCNWCRTWHFPESSGSTWLCVSSLSI